MSVPIPKLVIPRKVVLVADSKGGSALSEDSGSVLRDEDHSRRVQRTFGAAAATDHVRLSQLLTLAAQSCFGELENLLEVLPRMGNVERKRDILTMLAGQSQILQQCRVLVQWLLWLPEAAAAINAIQKLRDYQHHLVMTADQMAHATSVLYAHKMPRICRPSTFRTALGVAPSTPYSLQRLLSKCDPRIGAADVANLVKRQALALRVPDKDCTVSVSDDGLGLDFVDDVRVSLALVPAPTVTTTATVSNKTSWFAKQVSAPDRHVQMILLQQLQLAFPSSEAQDRSLLLKVCRLVRAVLFGIGMGSLVESLHGAAAKFDLQMRIAEERIGAEQMRLTLLFDWVEGAFPVIISRSGQTYHVLGTSWDYLDCGSISRQIISHVIKQHIEARLYAQLYQHLLEHNEDIFVFWRPEHVSLTDEGVLIQVPSDTIRISFSVLQKSFLVQPGNEVVPRQLGQVAQLAGKLQKRAVGKWLQANLGLNACSSAPFANLVRGWVWLQFPGISGGFIGINQSGHNGLTLYAFCATLLGRPCPTLQGHELATLPISGSLEFSDPVLKNFLVDSRAKIIEFTLSQEGIIFHRAPTAGSSDRLELVNAPVLFPVHKVFLNTRERTVDLELWEAMLDDGPNIRLESAPIRGLSEFICKACTAISFRYQLQRLQIPYSVATLDEVCLPGRPPLDLLGPSANLTALIPPSSEDQNK